MQMKFFFVFKGCSCNSIESKFWVFNRYYGLFSIATNVSINGKEVQGAEVSPICYSTTILSGKRSLYKTQNEAKWDGSMSDKWVPDQV